MSREDRPAPVYPENSERHLAQTWGEIRDITEQLFALVNIDVTPESYNNVTWFAPVVSKKHASLFKRVKSITDDAGGWTPKRTNASEYDKPRPKRKPRTPVENLDIAEIRSALDAIPNDDVHYDEWLKIGMCLHDTGAGEGLELWDDWSQKSHKYREGMCDEKWDTFSDDDGKKNRVLSSRKSNPSGIPLAGRILGVGHGGWGYALLALYRQNRNPLCRSCHSPQ